MAHLSTYELESLEGLKLEKINKHSEQTPVIIAAPTRGIAQLSEDFAPEATVCVRLDLEGLKCFEMVENQYQNYGVTFTNTMAIIPSNPAFPPYSGNIVLIGAPKSGYLEVVFNRPVRYVSGCVTSSRKAVLAAYDEDDKSVGHAEMSGANLAESESLISPNFCLSLKAKSIRRVTFLTFDGHLTVDDLCFSY